MQQRRHGHGKRPQRPRIDIAQLERVGIVLDFLPFGNRRDPHKHHQKEPVVQALGYRRFTLLDGIPLNFNDIDFLERVSLLSEVLKTIIRLHDTRRGLRSNVVLACYKERDSSTCFPVTPIEEDDVELLVKAFDERERVNIVLDFEAIERMLEDKSLPKLAIRVPPTPIHYEDLTPTARDNLRAAVERIVQEREAEFVEFFNMAEPINIRLHAIELLPGIGKKTLRKVLQYRTRKRFESYEEIHSIIKMDPVQALTEKILEELEGRASYYLFVKPRERGKPFLDYLGRLTAH
ncbi:MAG: DUF655 domain-containing protein [Desulfurococcales archaeon]|nr:DUF655 domain-containing protein [Desulfurococcales archaeon]